LLLEDIGSSPDTLSQAVVTALRSGRYDAELKKTVSMLEPDPEVHIDLAFF
jgi:hypothetical protein